MTLRYNEVNSRILRQNFLWPRFDGHGNKKGWSRREEGARSREENKGMHLFGFDFFFLVESHPACSWFFLVGISIIPATWTSTCFSVVLTWGLSSGKRFFHTIPSIQRDLHCNTSNHVLSLFLSYSFLWRRGHVSDGLGLRKEPEWSWPFSYPFPFWDLIFLQEACILLYFSMPWVLQKQVFFTRQGLCGKSISGIQY